MPLTPYEPPRRHRFDIVASDQNDRPVMVVEIKRTGDTRDWKRLVDDTKQYVDGASRKAPFFMMVTPDRIELYMRSSGEWQLAHTFDTTKVLRRYDNRYPDGPIYESYLASLIQVWLNDLAYNWHEANPPEAAVFEQLDVLNSLRDGTMAADAVL
jgi:hypothetical protein